MARVLDRLPDNAPGDFYVDRSCIDCGTCRDVAPGVFARSERAEASVVAAQPSTEAGRTRALMALVACPTSSIGSESKLDPREAAARFPERVDGDVYFCGYAAESAYGARSYLVVRPQGNVLVDSPRAARPLLDRLEALGGVRTMFLTHRDDVADHEVFARHFGCERVLHEADVGPSTRGVERRLAGREPTRLDDGLVAIPVPGHTRGSAALLWRDRYLFTGDHLLAAPERGGLHAQRDVCWYSWSDQIASMERLLEHSFTWVLPGHGRATGAPSASVMRARIRRVIDAMR